MGGRIVDALSVIVGLVIGFVVGVIVAWYYLRRQAEELRLDLERCRAAATATPRAPLAARATQRGETPSGTAITAAAPSVPAAVPAAAAVEQSAPAGDRPKDPLIDIIGIGPVFQRRFYDAGINTFAELAALSPQQIRDVVKAESWQKVEPEAWIAEALDRSR